MCFSYLVILLFSFVDGERKMDLKIDYYETLIKGGLQDAENFELRKDNSDFFENITDNKIYEYGSFDFIIIGAGSSGSVVANRLSENPEWTLLLLEAGEDEDDLSEIPGLHILLANSDKNWGYTTTRQKYGCFGMINRKCPYARGMSIGGSGAINGVIYFRGHKSDYDKWEEWGNPGWSYQNLSYYFKKSENSQIPDADESYHGFAGPLNNAYSYPESSLVRAFIKANEELGEKYIDINGEHSEGVGKCQNSVLFGRRASGGKSFVKPASNRVNLRILTKALVTKIIIDKHTKATQGVFFVRNGVKYRALVRKDVILSGGAINTPQLLMISGVGPKQELEKHGIKVIQNLAVGEKTKDHIAFNQIYFRTNLTGREIPLREQIKDYLNGFGVLTSAYSSKAISIKKFNDSQVEFIIVAPTRKTAIFSSPRNYDEEVIQTVRSFNSSTDIIISIILLNPKSSGTIKLKSSDMKDFPVIDIGIFSSERDLEVMFEAIKYAQKMGRTNSFQQFNATQFLKLKPCEKYRKNCRDYWFCVLRYMSLNGYHISSTARMGPKSDPLAVVDNELRVYGITSLRIIDCSIMPDYISGHTNAIAFAIGEKGADIIKNHYGFFESIV